MAKLASEGYRVITPDLYHRKGRLFGVDPEMRAADPSLSQQMMERLLSLTDDGIQHDADCALRAAGIGSDTPIAVLGFCLGARAVFRAMMRLPGQVVCGARCTRLSTPHRSTADTAAVHRHRRRR